MSHSLRVLAGLVVIAAGASSLTSCVSPTYGTDKTATEQLIEDIGDAVAVGSTKQKNEIAYAPRPGLVVPKEDRLALAEPQSSLSDRENNPNWVESPEEVRKRLIKEADEQGVGYRSPLAKQASTNRQVGIDQQKLSYEEKRKAIYGISDGKRRYLSDPPATYRKVDDASVLADLGESERAKEKRRKKEAKLATKGSSSDQWWDPLDLF